MKAANLNRVCLLVMTSGMLAAGLLGCATSHTTTSTGYTAFLAFEGKQSSWPQAPSALTQVDFAVPAYLGLPPKPYRVIGLIGIYAITGIIKLYTSLQTKVFCK